MNLTLRPCLRIGALMRSSNPTSRHAASTSALALHRQRDVRQHGDLHDWFDPDVRPCLTLAFEVGADKITKQKTAILRNLPVKVVAFGEHAEHVRVSAQLEELGVTVAQGLVQANAFLSEITLEELALPPPIQRCDAHLRRGQSRRVLGRATGDEHPMTRVILLEVGQPSNRVGLHCGRHFVQAVEHHERRRALE